MPDNSLLLGQANPACTEVADQTQQEGLHICAAMHPGFAQYNITARCDMALLLAEEDNVVRCLGGPSPAYGSAQDVELRVHDN